MSVCRSLEIGPFVVNLKSSLDTVNRSLEILYEGFPTVDSEAFIDYYISVDPPGLLRQIFRPQVNFSLDGFVPFKPLPVQEAYPLFEWGMNWCIASQAHQFFMLHAATLEKNGRVVILPAHPGSGKSTLCALLNHSGWRLLSDEFSLVDRVTGLIHPLVRPISLKNDSIQLLESFSSRIEIGSIVKDTSKGTVAHIKPLPGCVEKSTESASPAWVVFPKYEKDANIKVAPLHKADAFMKLVENAFNYSELGEQGFWAAKKLIDGCECFSLNYSNIDEALLFFSSLASEE